MSLKALPTVMTWYTDHDDTDTMYEMETFYETVKHNILRDIWRVSDTLMSTVKRFIFDPRAHDLHRGLRKLAIVAIALKCEDIHSLREPRWLFQ